MGSTLSLWFLFKGPMGKPPNPSHLCSLSHMLVILAPKDRSLSVLKLCGIMLGVGFRVWLGVGTWAGVRQITPDKHCFYLHSPNFRFPRGYGSCGTIGLG